MREMFEWDNRKALLNLKKHAVSFAEAMTVFMDPFSLTIHDPLHSELEERFVIVGESLKKRCLVVIHADRGDKIRIISARKANSRERISYEKAR
jgi:uncharacterized protein